MGRCPCLWRCGRQPRGSRRAAVQRVGGAGATGLEEAAGGAAQCGRESDEGPRCPEPPGREPPCHVGSSRVGHGNTQRSAPGSSARLVFITGFRSRLFGIRESFAG